MSMGISTTKSLVAWCVVALALVACSAEDSSEPAAETSPSTSTVSPSVGTAPSTDPSSALDSERADALSDLAAAASQQATELPTLLLIVNKTAHRVLLTSADAKHTATIDSGKSVRLASQRVCAWLPLTASSSGRVIDEYAEPCHGQTWTITD